MSGDWYFPDWHYYNNNGLDEWLSQFDNWNRLTPAVQGFVVGLLVIGVLIALTFLILQIIGMAKTFKKAKQPAWAAIVPFYNLFISYKLTGLELWWFIFLALALVCVPWPASVVLFGFFNYKLAKSFGKNVGFAIGLTLLPPIFWMILGCSSEIKYKGPDGPFKIK